MEKTSATTDLSSSKNRKRKTVEVTASASMEPKKKVGDRVFSLEDEIALLEGMIASNVSGGTKPMLVKLRESLDAKIGSFSDARLYEKIRRLKEKFRKLQQNPGSLGEHDAAVFRLGKKIWADVVADASKDQIGTVATASKKKGKKKVADGGCGDSSAHNELTEDEWKKEMLSHIACLLKKYEGKRQEIM